VRICAPTTYSAPPFAKSLGQERYCDDALTAIEVLVQFIYDLNCKDCPGTYFVTKTATVPVPLQSFKFASRSISIRPCGWTDALKFTSKMFKLSNYRYYQTTSGKAFFYGDLASNFPLIKDGSEKNDRHKEKPHLKIKYFPNNCDCCPSCPCCWPFCSINLC